MLNRIPRSRTGLSPQVAVELPCRLRGESIIVRGCEYMHFIKHAVASYGYRQTTFKKRADEGPNRGHVRGMKKNGRKNALDGTSSYARSKPLVNICSKLFTGQRRSMNTERSFLNRGTIQELSQDLLLSRIIGRMYWIGRSSPICNDGEERIYMAK